MFPSHIEQQQGVLTIETEAMESRQPQPEQDATAASVLPDSVVALEALEKQEARSRPDSQVGHGKDIMPYESRASSVSGTPAMLFTENHPLKVR